jgi:archaellum component FlaF (FlaF/FlaG flagellin family)
MKIYTPDITGSFSVTGSVTATGGFTGSLFGTASWSNNAETASFVTLAQTASFVTLAQSASYVLNAETASFASSISTNLNQNVTITGSLILSGSTTTEIDVKGDVIITGSLIVSGSGGSGIFSKGGTIIDLVNGLNITSSINVWRAPYKSRVVAVYGYKSGSGTTQVNAKKSGSTAHLASNISVTNNDTWTVGGTVQNTDYNPGDSLELIVTSSAFEVSVQVDFIKIL